MFSKNYTTNKGYNQFILETEHLTQGMYFLMLDNGVESTNIKFIKEKKYLLIEATAIKFLRIGSMQEDKIDTKNPPNIHAYLFWFFLVLLPLLGFLFLF